MTPAAVRAELATLEQHRERLEVQRVQYAAAAEAALVADKWDPRASREARADLARVIEQLEVCGDRREALAKSMPSAATVREAEQEIENLRRSAATAAAAFSKAEAAYIAGCAGLERAARTLAAARLVAQQTIAAMIDVANAAGLDPSDVPAYPELAPRVAAMTRLQAILAAETAHGAPDDVTVRDLNAAIAEHTAGALQGAA